MKEYFKKIISENLDYYAEMILSLFENDDDLRYSSHYIAGEPDEIKEIGLIKIDNTYYDKKSLRILFTRNHIAISSDFYSSGVPCTEKILKEIFNVILKGNYDVDLDNDDVLSSPSRYSDSLQLVLKSLSDEEKVLLEVNYPQIIVKHQTSQDILKNYLAKLDIDSLDNDKCSRILSILKGSF